jgi:uncharacterized protein (TIGR03435 family)
MSKLLFVVAALALAAPFASADDSHPAFEAASIKRNTAGPGPTQLVFQPGGRIRITNLPLKSIIAAAYGTPQPLTEFQLVGGPRWIETDRFDIIAKAAGDPPPGPGGPPPVMFEMLRTLLDERFHLTIHRETRDLPMFALVLARNDGRLGPQLHQSATDCAALMASMMARARAGGPPPAPPAPGERPPCGARMFPGNISAGGMTMVQIVNGLSRTPGVNRPVSDRTGLSGAFDFDLTFTPEQMPQGERPAGAPPIPPIDPNGPSLFTALQEQLGLKLEPTKGPVEVIVIDGVEPPTED